MPNIEAPWAKIPLHVASDDSLVLGDIRVYVALDYLAGKRGHWYGSLEQIAATAGVSRPTAARAIDALRERDYISTVRMGLEKRNVLRYMIHARTIAADDVIAGDNAPASSTITTDVITDDHGKDTDLPQTSTTDSLSPRGFSEQAYVSATGRSVRNTMLRYVLEGIDAAHPPECVKSVWEGSAGANEPWSWAKSKFDRCQMEGHWPRQRGSNGTNSGTNGRGGGVRSGNGASERRPEGAGGGRDRPLTDAEAEQERIRRRERSEEIRAARAAAGKVV